MKPVFIGGCHRSGTTLLGALLGAHPQCLTTPESQFKTDALKGVGVPHTETQWNTVLERASGMRSLSRWSVSDGLLSDAALSKDRDYAALLVRMVGEFAQSTGQGRFDVWVDHTPKNIWHLETLLGLYPEGKAIHIVRDGRGVAASVMGLDWGPNTVIAAAHWWIHHVAFGLAAESHFGERVLRVRYEDLVATPQPELERICEWLEIDYVPAMESGGGFNYPKGTFRYHSLIHDAPDPSRVTAWRDALSSRQIASFESCACDLLPYLGYDVLNDYARAALADRLQTLIVEPAMIAVNGIRFRLWRAKKDRMLARQAERQQDG